jgi:crotonobetainyl-CoA:carnitine CoA-transferase CaiB-like acyl-CoA transferase
MSLLPPIRVLDIAGEFSGLAGMLLAQMGAEVIRIEPPKGEPARDHAPLHNGISLPWAAFNLSKQAITLNLHSEKGRALFLSLVDTADVVLESFRPGTLAALDLAPSTLIARKPDLVVTSLTAFGQDGPRAGNAASDTTIMALSGLMAVTGFPGLPPLRLGYDQISSLAGLQTVLGTQIALYARGSDGMGQHVDVSALDAARLANYREPLRWEFQRAIETRRGNVARRGRGGFTSNVWQCRDGWITWSSSDDPKRARSLFDKAHEQGVALDWREHDFASELPADMDQPRIDAIEAAIAPFFLNYTRAELEQMARDHGWILIAFLDLAEATAQPQLAARGYWTRAEFGTGTGNDTGLPVPAYPFVTSADQPGHRGPAPTLGQDNSSILGALGHDAAALETLRAEGVI